MVTVVALVLQHNNVLLTTDVVAQVTAEYCSNIKSTGLCISVMKNQYQVQLNVVASTLKILSGCARTGYHSQYYCNSAIFVSVVQVTAFRNTISAYCCFNSANFVILCRNNASTVQYDSTNALGTV